MHANQNSGSAPRLSVEELAAQIREGRRAALARAITLIESRKPEHRERANALLAALHDATGAASRIGVTGLPGVGKSTFIDRFGSNLAAEGRRVAVLAVDPSSQRTGGSILADKTRMHTLAARSDAFIRPSPAGRTLGGVARATRETMLLCEAAGYDVIIVETVGVGQSENAVAGMVDFFLVLLLPGAGDEWQGLKKGLIELADMIAVNKADGDMARQAAATAADYNAALHILGRSESGWTPEAVAISSQENRGLDDLWAAIQRHRRLLETSGAFDAKRREQAVAWMHEVIEDRLRERLRGDPALKERIAGIEADVRKGEKLPGAAADEILALAGIG